MSKPAKQTNYNNLIKELAAVIDAGRHTAVRYVNVALVATYWSIGRRMVEYEQAGKQRTEYGQELLKRISDDLTIKFGRGFSPDNLEAMRRFYSVYKISETPSRKLEPQDTDFITGYAARFKLIVTLFSLGCEKVEQEPSRHNDETEKAIRQLENRRFHAMIEADTAALDTILADDLTYTHTNWLGRYQRAVHRLA